MKALIKNGCSGIKGYAFAHRLQKSRVGTLLCPRGDRNSVGTKRAHPTGLVRPDSVH